MMVTMENVGVGDGEAEAKSKGSAARQWRLRQDGMDHEAAHGTK